MHFLVVTKLSSWTIALADTQAACSPAIPIAKMPATKQAAGAIAPFTIDDSERAFWMLKYARFGRGGNANILLLIFFAAGVEEDEADAEPVAAATVPAFTAGLETAAAGIVTRAWEGAATACGMTTSFSAGLGFEEDEEDAEIAARMVSAFDVGLATATAGVDMPDPCCGGFEEDEEDAETAAGMASEFDVGRATATAGVDMPDPCFSCKNATSSLAGWYLGKHPAAS
eukprot:gnl/TRDRNA2_/TRDRNA2_168563_c1_seq1.p2 gnl/TRDRNA2_/TRDRNA2_168563_c1~~gnl/TRDRNA2_/TRDRNA2_168563_c1_seq1.p2  ORF type:complete len:228 (-),score=37.49 gnl/TRDRNA2_/TRDRNA2_168563_c1_seq1:142-825(-)